MIGPSKTSFEWMESLSSSRRPSIHEDSDGIESEGEQGREEISAAAAAWLGECDSSWLKMSIVRRETLSSSLLFSPTEALD